MNAAINLVMFITVTAAAVYQFGMVGLGIGAAVYALAPYHPRA